jgi:MYXO-CTERM domain-containing protein
VTRPGRLAAAAAIGLALFAILFSAGAALGLWPQPPEGGFQGVDLYAGLAFGAALLFALLLRRRPPLR